MNMTLAFFRLAPVFEIKHVKNVKIDIFDMVLGDQLLIVSKVSNLTLLTQNAFLPFYRRLLLFFFFGAHK